MTEQTTAPAQYRSDDHRRPGAGSPGRRFRADERAVSEVLGSILLFGLLMTVLVLIQTNAVPAQNQQVEFEHNQRVQQDMLGLDRAVLQAATSDVPTTADVELSDDEMAALERLDPPAFVAVTGKARTFQPEDSDLVYTSVRPESFATVDADIATPRSDDADTSETEPPAGEGVAEDPADAISVSAATVNTDAVSLDTNKGTLAYDLTREAVDGRDRRSSRTSGKTFSSSSVSNGTERNKSLDWCSRTPN